MSVPPGAQLYLRNKYWYEHGYGSTYSVGILVPVPVRAPKKGLYFGGEFVINS